MEPSSTSPVPRPGHPSDAMSTNGRSNRQTTPFPLPLPTDMPATLSLNNWPLSTPNTLPGGSHGELASPGSSLSPLEPLLVPPPFPPPPPPPPLSSPGGVEPGLG